MKHPLILIILFLLFLAIAACQGDSEPSISATPVFEPGNTPPVRRTAPAISEPTVDGTAVETIVPTPTSLPTIEGGGDDMSERNADADVEFVRAIQATDGSWTFHVTVKHPDTGWEDYADGWDVVAPDGTVLKANETDPFTRLLLHPHENEQPFTRSQSGIMIPEGITQVSVRAHDIVDGFGGREVVVNLTVPADTGFEVERSTQ